MGYEMLIGSSVPGDSKGMHSLKLLLCACLATIAGAGVGACNSPSDRPEVVRYTIPERGIRDDVLSTLDANGVSYRVERGEDVVVSKSHQREVEQALVAANNARYPRCSVRLESDVATAVFLDLAKEYGLVVEVVQNEKGPQYIARQEDCARFDKVLELMHERLASIPARQ